MAERLETNGHLHDEVYQYRILTGVSRTFALTIPQLPGNLRRTVTNAYLLCRIADTIEDDPGVSADDKAVFHKLFVDVINGQADPVAFSSRLASKLTDESSPQERELIHNTQNVVNVTWRLGDTARNILARRIEIMCRGMPKFQRNPSRDGLRDLAAMDQYCYYVAGVVGQMLTELFCNHSDKIFEAREELFRLAPSFGQGLQMTNILKDVWDDQKRGACWLPRDIFLSHGYDLGQLAPDYRRTEFLSGLQELTGIAHGHLRNAISYSLLIPRTETGVRKFCLWSVGMALLTLKKILRNPGYRSGQQVKISRRAVKATVAATNSVCRSNTLVRALFRFLERDLPLNEGVSTYRAFGDALLIRN